MTRAVVVFGNGVPECLVKLLYLRIKNLWKTEQIRHRNPALN